MSGTVDRMGAQEQVHPALAAHLQDGEREIARRVWRAELGVLFPFIEEQRMRMIETLGSRLKVPWPTPYGEVRDPRDLELSHLVSQARAIRGAERHVPLLDHLRRIRNALAHGENVPWKALTGADLERGYEGR